jgi:ribA/ribD-fused uncharacterized protein
MTIEIHGLDTDQEVFFYEQDFYPFSNFSSFQIEWKGIVFQTSEHVYHYEKFNCNEGRITQAKILLSRSAHDAFKIAQTKEGRRPDWEEIKVDVMRQILWLKIDQHDYVQKKLLATGTRRLVENSWRDDFWGWGPNRDGKNMLGRVWMELRTEMTGRKSDHPY